MDQPHLAARLRTTITALHPRHAPTEALYCLHREPDWQIRRALSQAERWGWVQSYADGWGVPMVAVQRAPRRRAAPPAVVDRALAVTDLVRMIGGLVPTRPLGSPLGLRHAQLLGALSEAVRRGWLGRHDAPGRPPRWYVPAGRIVTPDPSQCNARPARPSCIVTLPRQGSGT